MATKLGLYNAALIEIGESHLSSLTEARKPRYLLDTVYDDVLEDCLEAGDWNHAIREVKAVSDTGVTEAFGFTETIGKPTDWVRTVALSANAEYWPPLADHEYQDAVNFWATNVTPIYVKYVSNGTSYGLDLTLWPRSFTRFVEVALADRICGSETQNAGDKERLEKVTLPRAKRNALNKDAMNEGMKFHRVSTWNAARGGGGRRERGNPNSFTG